MKVGIFSLSCCEGCSVEFLNLEAKILEVLKHYDIVNFRIAMDMKELPVDIAFVEGTPTTPDEVRKLLKIRKSSDILVALGSCAATAGVLGLANTKRSGEKMEVYGGNPPYVPVSARPISDYVDVDYTLPGCPFSRDELLELLTDVVLGKNFRLPEKSVCVECSLRENACLLDRGVLCMGPVTRGGCGAVCPSNNAPCDGCRGPYRDANFKAHVRALMDIGISREEIIDAYSLFSHEPLREVIAWLKEE